MEVMEAREALDNAESLEAVDQIRRDNLGTSTFPACSDTFSNNISAEKIDALLPELSAAIAEKDWPTVKELAIKLKYLQGIDLAAHTWPARPFDH